MPRITLKFLRQQVDDFFTRHELPYETIEAYRTRYSGDQYEGGAAMYIIRCTQKDNNDHIFYFSIRVHCWIREMQNMFDSKPHYFTVALRDNKYISDSELVIKEGTLTLNQP